MARSFVGFLATRAECIEFIVTSVRVRIRTHTEYGILTRVHISNKKQMRFRVVFIVSIHSVRRFVDAGN